MKSMRTVCLYTLWLKRRSFLIDILSYLFTLLLVGSLSFGLCLLFSFISFIHAHTFFHTLNLVLSFYIYYLTFSPGLGVFVLFQNTTPKTFSARRISLGSEYLHVSPEVGEIIHFIHYRVKDMRLCNNLLDQNFQQPLFQSLVSHGISESI